MVGASSSKLIGAKRECGNVETPYPMNAYPLISTGRQGFPATRYTARNLSADERTGFHRDWPNEHKRALDLVRPEGRIYRVLRVYKRKPWTFDDLDLPGVPVRVPKPSQMLRTKTRNPTVDQRVLSSR